MPIDPSTGQEHRHLDHLHPDQDQSAILQQAVIAAKQLFDADAAGIMLTDLDGNLRWASASESASPDLGGQPGGTRRRPLRQGRRGGPEHAGYTETDMIGMTVPLAPEWLPWSAARGVARPAEVDTALAGRKATILVTTAS